MPQDAAGFRLMGLEPSPYTMKVRSFLRFKGITFEWVSRNLKAEKEYQAHAKVQLIPLLFFPDGETMQDSTPILERLDKDFPEPAMQPDDPALWFLSCLFEEFGDEWCNKLMFFQRWFYPADAKSTGNRLARERFGGEWWSGIARPIAARMMVRRMVPRLVYSGGNATNIPQLKESFENLVALLEAHLRTRHYLLGARPCFGDFGLWCNLHQAWTDPTANAYLEAHAPTLVAYIKRMLNPSVDGDFETLEALRPTLTPILEQEMATRFLPWMATNHRAFETGANETSLQMNGQLFQQKTFKYQAMTLDELRRKFATVSGNAELTGLLDETGCLPFLGSAPVAA